MHNASPHIYLLALNHYTDFNLYLPFSHFYLILFPCISFSPCLVPSLSLYISGLPFLFSARIGQQTSLYSPKYRVENEPEAECEHPGILITLGRRDATSWRAPVSSRETSFQLSSFHQKLGNIIPDPEGVTSYYRRKL